MSLILSGVFTLLQHVNQLQKDPESYRPAKCPCGHGRVWCHGRYTRKPCCSDPAEQVFAPVQVLRYYCPDCHATCSVLPECLPPRSWYLWKVRQIIFLSLIVGTSMRRTVAQYGSNSDAPHETTIKRWWKRFQANFVEYSFHLRNHFSWLGRQSFTAFWITLLQRHSLSSVMCLLACEGVTVP